MDRNGERAPGRWALTVDGEITLCHADAEHVGKGSCKHVGHQNANESMEQFLKRMESAEKDAKHTIGATANNTKSSRVSDIKRKKLAQNLSYHNSFGDEFENVMIERFQISCAKEWGKGSIKRAAIDEDVYEGTDFKILGVPADITLNMSGKSNTRVSKHELDLGFAVVSFGIRSGNGVKIFDHNVVVINFDIALNGKREIGEFSRLFNDQDIINIMNEAMDVYYNNEDGEFE
jgi:hypothetical protein